MGNIISFVLDGAEVRWPKGRAPKFRREGSRAGPPTQFVLVFRKHRFSMQKHEGEWIVWHHRPDHPRDANGWPIRPIWPSTCADGFGCTATFATLEEAQRFVLAETAKVLLRPKDNIVPLAFDGTTVSRPRRADGPAAMFLGPVPGLTPEWFTLVDGLEPEWLLTAAVNSLRVTWGRHQGGHLSEEDRNVMIVGILACRRALIEGIPRQEGGIG